jgi:DNA-binding NarL/FixJ family response regulator
VLIACESNLCRRTLKEILERRCKRLKIVDCCMNMDDLTRALTRGVDVALIDYAPRGLKVECLIQRSCWTFPQTRFVALVKQKNAKTVVGAFREGVRGIFDSSGTVDALCKCICTVHDGQIWASSEDLMHIIESLAEAPLPSVDPPKLALLSERETDVANPLIEGLSNREIATQLGLTEHTVTNYLYNAYEKLGISKRIELILLFKRHDPTEA